MQFKPSERHMTEIKEKLSHREHRGHREKKSKSIFFCLFLSVLSVSSVVKSPSPVRAQTSPSAPLYANDFEKSPEGDPPADLTHLDRGEFKIKTVDSNKLLELPGDPVEKYGMLFGPEDQSFLCVSARIYGTSTGKRFPEFGVGLGDSNGYKLWLMPATGQLQIYRHEDVVATVPYAWKSGTWTSLRLQVRRINESKFVVEGKSWPHGAAEPKDWSIAYIETQEPPKGRATVWGSPYSSTPIRFDDLMVTTASPGASQ